MAYITHAKENKLTNGIIFRVWSTITKTYVTGDLTEAQLKKWWLRKIVRDAIFLWGTRIDAHIERARKNGTSAMTEGHRGTKEWRKESQ